MRAFALAAVVLFVCLNSGSGHSRTSVFETVSDEDARLISAYLALRIELHQSSRGSFVLSPNPANDEAERVASALVNRLRRHGFTAKIAGDAKPCCPVSISVKPLTHAVWVRISAQGQPFFFLFERHQDGLLSLSMESRLVER